MIAPPRRNGNRSDVHARTCALAHARTHASYTHVHRIAATFQAGTASFAHATRAANPGGAGAPRRAHARRRDTPRGRTGARGSIHMLQRAATCVRVATCVATCCNMCGNAVTKDGPRGVTPPVGGAVCLPFCGIAVGRRMSERVLVGAPTHFGGGCHSSCSSRVKCASAGGHIESVKGERGRFDLESATGI
jgi:hypothetical protein